MKREHNIDVELPIGYRKLEYLKCTGSQYIITGYVPRIGDMLEISFKYDGSVPSDYNYRCLFSAGTGNYQYIVLASKNNDLDGFYYKYFATGTASEFVVSQETDEWYDIKIDGFGKIQCGQHSSASAPKNEIDGNANTMSVFVRRNIQSPLTDGCIRHITATRDGGEVLNMVPALRESDNEPGMYDIANDVFYTNAGTGEFMYK